MTLVVFSAVDAFAQAELMAWGNLRGLEEINLSTRILAITEPLSILQWQSTPPDVGELVVFVTDRQRGMEPVARVATSVGTAQLRLDAVSFTSLVTAL